MFVGNHQNLYTWQPWKSISSHWSLRSRVPSLSVSSVSSLGSLWTRVPWRTFRSWRTTLLPSLNKKLSAETKYLRAIKINNWGRGVLQGRQTKIVFLLAHIYFVWLFINIWHKLFFFMGGGDTPPPPLNLWGVKAQRVKEV